MAMKSALALSVLGMSFMLTACGGGGGGGVESTPAPYVPPRLMSTSFNDLVTQTDFALTGVTSSRTDTSTASGGTMGATTITPRLVNDGSLTISYSAAIKGYIVHNNATSQVFRAEDLRPDLAFYGPAISTYSRTEGGTSDFLSIYRPAGGGADIPLTYTTLVSSTRVTSDPSGATRNETLWGTAGFTTPAADMPRTGSASYLGPLRGVSVNGTALTGVAGQARLSANFAAQSVQADLFLNRTGFSTLVVGGSGAIQANRFNGNLSGSGFNGVFGGAFFGPQATEMGLSFSIANPDGTQIFGAGAGRK